MLVLHKVEAKVMLTKMQPRSTHKNYHDNCVPRKISVLAARKARVTNICAFLCCCCCCWYESLPITMLAFE